jgi:RHS repeat-associated protein
MQVLSLLLPAPQPWTATMSTANNNQITKTSSSTQNWTYDAAGDVTFDGINDYLYDGEGRICAVENSYSPFAKYGYLYDANGNRIAKGTLSSFSCILASNGFALTNSYVVGADSQQLTEFQGSTAVHTNVFGGGTLLATYANSQTYFTFTDWLGTKRAEIAANCKSTYASLSYGDELTPSGNCADATEHHYTGKERDTESGNDYFGARYYASSMGRFMSPDWSSKPEPVPYANLEYPQTLNLYSYAGNNPLTRTDPDGHCTNGGAQKGFWWCLFNDSDQDAARARQQLAAYKNISVNGKTPADAAKGLSNTQTVQLERSVFNYISSQAMSTPGMMLGLAIVPGGAEEVGPLEIAAASDRAVAAGEATQWIVQTGKSALATDIRTNITAAEFGTNLEASGFVKSVAKDGVTTLYSKGNEVYSVYSKASSTGGAAANLNVGGQIVTKIRLQ